MLFLFNVQRIFPLIMILIFLIFVSQILAQRELFPDYDCRHVKSEILDYNAWRMQLATTTDGLIEKSAETLYTIENYRAAAENECPLAVFTADAMRVIVCWIQHREQGCYGDFAARLQTHFKTTKLEVLIGTEWPILAILNNNIWLADDAPTLYHYNCIGVPEFTNFLSIFEQASERFGYFHSEDGDWFNQAVAFSFGEIESNWQQANVICPLGFLAANIVKMCMCAWTESICFANHAWYVIQHLSQHRIHTLAGSKWPIISILHFSQQHVKRHNFHLDFNIRELTGMPDFHNLSESYQAVASTALILNKVKHEDLNVKFTIATVVHGEEFSKYLPRFVRRALSVGVKSLFIFTLDRLSYEKCRTLKDYYSDGLACVPGHKSIMNKFLLPLVLLQFDYDVLWLDFDTFLFQDPTPYILSQAYHDDYDLLVGGAFAAECVCSGIMYYKAKKVVKDWLIELVSWMYNHPYEHDQKLVSAFLFAGERVAFPHELPVGDEECKRKVPRWGYLDAGNMFIGARHVDVAGWTGRFEDIVVFHFFHGRSETSEAGYLQNYTREESDWLPLMDMFYGHADEKLFASQARMPWEYDDLQSALLKSRWEARPPDPLPKCSETIPLTL